MLHPKIQLTTQLGDLQSMQLPKHDLHLPMYHPLSRLQLTHLPRHHLHQPKNRLLSYVRCVTADPCITFMGARRTQESSVAHVHSNRIACLVGATCVPLAQLRVCTTVFGWGCAGNSEIFNKESTKRTLNNGGGFEQNTPLTALGACSLETSLETSRGPLPPHFFLLVYKVYADCVTISLQK